VSAAVFVNANGGELWGTRNALRFAQDANWVCVARGIGNGNVDIEFSRDLENCYINVGNGGIWRVDGLGSVYTSDTLFNAKVSYDVVAGIPTTPTYTTATKISRNIWFFPSCFSFSKTDIIYAIIWIDCFPPIVWQIIWRY
jgi:hypothetical protein